MKKKNSVNKLQKIKNEIPRQHSKRNEERNLILGTKECTSDDEIRKVGMREVCWTF